MALPCAAIRNLPLSPPELERRLETAPLIITAAERAKGGVMGAKKLTVVFGDDGERLEVKWKKAPVGGDGWNNSPRREIGVYRIQKLFLDPDDYLVPPVVVRGIEFEAFRPVDPEPQANIEGTQCVYGTLSVWLRNAILPERVFDPEFFACHDGYAHHFGKLNLLHYLVDHRDSRTNNFLVSTDPDDPRIFSVDNGIAFGGTLFNFFTWHFDKIRVDRVPREQVERLRRLKRSDLDQFGVLSELRVDPAGVLRHVAPGPNLDSDQGNRVQPGVVQIGLTSAEIDAIAERLQSLLARIDDGELKVF